MNARFVTLVLATLLIASPLALASLAPTLSAKSLAIDGAGRVDGSAGALFIVLDADGIVWDATAASVEIERAWMSFVSADAPVLGRASVYDGRGEQTASDAYERATLSGTSWREGAAILVRLLDDEFTVEATTRSGMEIVSVVDPEIAQEEADVDTRASSDEGPNYLIRDELSGEYVDITTRAAEFVLRGNVEIRVLGLDYAVTSLGEATEYRTGRTEDRDAPATQGRIEKNTLVLTDAVLRIRNEGTSRLLASSPSVTFSGALVADEPEGALDLPTLASSAPGRWTGSGTLDLTPAPGSIGAAPPAALAATGAGAIVTRTPPMFAYVAGAVALAALVAFALVIRLRRAQGDDLELALLAMEERRWGDALPHLDRLAARRPHDAVVLMDRAICLEESGRLDEARKGYEAALREQPHSAEAHYYYARTLARLRMGTAALAHLTRALTLDARLAELARDERAFATFSDHPQFRGLVG